jgi:multiple sugar transport system ATP-binding protein
MNFLPGTVMRTSGEARVSLDGGGTVPAPRDAGGVDGQRVVYGVRPEHLSLGGREDGLAAKVVVVEPTGMDTQVFTKFGGVEVTAVFRERHEFKAGEPILLLPDHDRTHLFDADSGKSLMQR